METNELLKELSTRTAVSGREHSLTDFLKESFAVYCDNVDVDKFYNVVGIKKGEGGLNRKIMLTAHFDEIGLMVKSIDERGFIRFTNVGGIDAKILLAQEVVIHGRQDVYGIIGAKPPHLMKPEEAKKAVKMDKLAIDTGMNADKVKELVSVGDVITFKTQPFTLLGSKLSSKSIDNRSGVLCLIETMKGLGRIKYKSDVYFVATAQEEFQLAGINASAYNIQPDIAIVIDACHGDMPDSPKTEIYSLGKGPALAVGPNLHRKLSKKLIETAKEINIKYQVDVEPSDTGTEAWATQVSRAGIPTVLVSIPVRYMHTAIETVSMDDISKSARLCAEFISRTEQELEEILCY